MTPRDELAIRDKLAIHGGRPVRSTLLPYGRQTVDEADIEAVVSVLRSDWLTTGPVVGEFEAVFADFVGAAEAVVVNSGTAALHVAMHALGIGPSDEVIVPAMTFAATANAVVHMGGIPVFADVDPQTLLLSPESAESRITPQTKALVAVDYAGQPCDYDALRALAQRHGLALVADACHALGATYHDKKVGSLADLSTFSFHPVKPLTTCEGGMITTDDSDLAEKMRAFRNHGITRDHRQRTAEGSWFYEMETLGFNYRLSDVQCALGKSQLSKLDGWISRRNEIAAAYRDRLREMPEFQPLAIAPGRTHAWHLFVVRCDVARLGWSRTEIFAALRAENIGVNVHYIPVHWHPFYREKFGTKRGDCPQAEAAYEEILTLPIFPGMQTADVDDVIAALRKIRRAASRK